MTDRCESLRDSVRPPAKPLPSHPMTECKIDAGVEAVTAALDCALWYWRATSTKARFDPTKPMSYKAARLLSINGLLLEA